MMRYLTLLILLCTTLLIGGCQKERSDDETAGAFLEIRIFNEIDGQPLQLNSPLINTFNETFTLTDYKYYISNLEMISPAKPYLIPDSYYLVDEQNQDSKILKASIKAETYDALVFMIGVDSTRQVRGPQTGVLDPSKGMFWGPNLGYMAAKLEGTSPFSGAPGNVLQQQIGGFEGQYNALRYVVIPFPALTVNPGQTLQLNLKAELLRWFDGIYPMTIAGNPVITAPSTPGMQIADNYSELFSLSSVEVK